MLNQPLHEQLKLARYCVVWLCVVWLCGCVLCGVLAVRDAKDWLNKPFVMLPSNGWGRGTMTHNIQWWYYWMTSPHINHTYFFFFFLPHQHFFLPHHTTTLIHFATLTIGSGTHVAKCGAMYGIRKIDTIFVSDLGHSNAQENANNRVS